MLAVVEAPGAAIRPEPLEQVDREGPLPFDRERPFQVVAVDLARRRLTLSTICHNDRGQPVVVGEALVMVDA
jgi:hypothetical protein